MVVKKFASTQVVELLIGDTDANNAFSGGDDLVIGNTDSRIKKWNYHCK